MPLLRIAGPSRHRSVWSLRACALALTALACLCSTRSRAQDDARADQPEASVGPGHDALRGLYYTGMPLAPRELTVRATLGYGVTERIAPGPAAAHRLQSGLAVGATPLPWLGFGLRLDGRLEFHGDDGRGAHVAGFGDPRLYGRVGHALTEELWLGGQLGVWFPGEQAPSIVPSATSLEGRAQLSYHPRASAFTWLGSFGARWDNSAKAAPDRARLRVGDRTTLGLSDSNALLAAVGAVWRATPEVQIFGELSADLFVGSRSPALRDTPMRLAAGGRYALSSTLQAELTGIFSLSGRPGLGTDASLVPIEPRALCLISLAYTLPLTAAAPPPPKPKPVQEPAKPATPSPLPTLVAVSGKIVDDRGEPLPDVRVTLQSESGAQFETVTDGHGNYNFAAVPSGTAQLEAQAVGFDVLAWSLTLQPGIAQDEAPRTLAPTSDTGILRGLIRSFDSTPLRAVLVIRNTRGRVVKTLESGADGRVEAELRPGRYTVTIDAPGYRRQTQMLRIQSNGVSVLNTDMRTAP